MAGAVEGGRRRNQRLGEGGVKGEGALVTHRQHGMALPGEDLVSYARQRNGGQGLCFLSRKTLLVPGNQTVTSDGWSLEPASESPRDPA